MVYKYTAAGDSLTFGVGALPGSGFVSLYRRMAEEYLQVYVSYNNLGINGLTSDELYGKIMKDSLFRNSLKEAEVITISIGGNDLIQAAKSGGDRSGREQLEKTLVRCQQNISGCISLIHQLKLERKQPYFIRVVGLYNPYPSWREAVEYVTRFNRYLLGLDHGGILRVADIYSKFAGKEQKLLSFDHIHPNTKGHRVIAEQLNRLGYKPLR